MKKQYTIIANWKMSLPFNKSIEFATNHYDEFLALSSTSGQKIILCPSFESLYPLTKIFKQTRISIGAQDCSPHISGSFTSQISPKSLSELGCTHCIVGHSETRAEYSLSDEKIAQKFIHLLDYDIIPILCLGETKEEFDNKETLKILKSQLSPIFDKINSNGNIHSYLTPIIAYEPIWSIGTGQTADTGHLDMIFSWLAEITHKKCPKIKFNLIYGGSVTPEKVAYFKKIDKIDGFLVGNSSLDFQNFEKIVE